MRNPIRFVAIDRWPMSVKATITSPFSTPYGKTLDLLDRELTHLGASQVIMQAFLQPHQIRQDGWPYSNANPARPGVILSFKSRAKGDLSFPCYRYTRFEDNIRAIALSLEALRAVDRYGVTQSAEQYVGWKQIEAPLPGGFRGREDAALFLATQNDDEDPETPDTLITNREARKVYYRDAAARLHPDKSTGDHELFIRLQQAMAILEGKTPCQS